MSGFNTENLSAKQDGDTHFNLRCPSCDKLYCIDANEIISSSPQFDCNACKSRFTFDFPLTSLDAVETRIVTKKKLNKAVAEQLEFMTTLESEIQITESAPAPQEPVMMKLDANPKTSPHLKTCPKCRGTNALLNKECDQCGILFERVNDVPMDRKLGVFPSLVKAWQDLMTDYDNIAKHIKFVDRCEDLQALPFALKKYEALKEAQPQDPVVKQMFHRVLIKSLKTKTENISWIQQSTAKLKDLSAQVNWERVRKAAPIAIAVGLIIYGFARHGSRNLVGIGAAILFLSIGLKAFVKGRISFEDFW